MTEQPGKSLKNSRNSKDDYPRTLEDLLNRKIDLEKALRELQFIDQCVLLFRFWEHDQLERVAERLNMNIKAVSAVEQRAIAKLRKIMEVE